MYSRAYLCELVADVAIWPRCNCVMRTCMYGCVLEEKKSEFVHACTESGWQTGEDDATPGLVG